MLKFLTMKAFRFKIKRSGKTVTKRFENTLDLCRELYNSALQERIEAWKAQRKTITRFDQDKQLPEIKDSRPEFKEIYSQILQDVLNRLDKSFKAFYARVRRGENPGFPRYKTSRRFNSFTFPQSGFSLKGESLTLSKIGTIKLRLSREIVGRIKTCTIKREVDGWYIIFALETEKILLPKTDQVIGIDVGLEHFATLSNGVQIENPRFLQNSEQNLKKAQRRVTRKKRGSNRRRKSVKLLQKKYLKIRRQRQDFFQKTANQIVKNFDEIAVEDLKIGNLVRNHRLAKSITDASWGYFIQILEYKAEEAGRRVWKVNPNGTSQICICGEKVEKTLRIRHHKCLSCGYENHRDIVSAQVILERAVGQTAQTLTYRVAESVV